MEQEKAVFTQMELPFYDGNTEEYYISPSDDSFMRVIFHFETFPFYTLNKKRVPYFERTFKIKEGAEASFVCDGSSKLKAPNYFDFSVFRIIMLLANRKILGGGYIEFSTYEIIKLLEKLGTHSKTKQVNESIERLHATTYRLSTSYTEQGYEKYTKKAFHIFDEVIQKGERLENGQVAEKQYVKLSRPTFRAVIENQLKPINYEYEFSLEYPLSRAVYSKLHSKFYGRSEGSLFSIRYSNFCEWINIKRETFYSNALQVISPKLDILIRPDKDGEHFLSSWKAQNKKKTPEGVEFTLIFSKGNYRDVRDNIKALIDNVEVDEVLEVQQQQEESSSYSYGQVLSHEKYVNYLQELSEGPLNEFFDFWMWFKNLPSSHKLKNLIKGRLNSVLKAYIAGVNNPERKQGIFLLPDEWEEEKLRIFKLKQKKEDRQLSLLKFEEEQQAEMDKWLSIPLEERISAGIKMVGDRFTKMGEEYQEIFRKIVMEYEMTPLESNHSFLTRFDTIYNDYQSEKLLKTSEMPKSSGKVKNFSELSAMIKGGVAFTQDTLDEGFLNK